MTTKAKCEEYAAAQGYTIEDFDCDIRVEYPHRNWDGDVHEWIIDFSWGRVGAWRKVWKAMREMDKLVIACEDADCEWCNS